MCRVFLFDNYYDVLLFVGNYFLIHLLLFLFYHPQPVAVWVAEQASACPPARCYADSGAAASPAVAVAVGLYQKAGLEVLCEFYFTKGF